jgi:glycosyltransferase involved in cell wall biosynthesis
MPGARRLHILILLTDAYGGNGGIAKFNRDFINALASDDRVETIVAIPRLMPNPSEPRPGNVIYAVDAARGKLRFAWRALSSVLVPGKFDLVICAHINLLPIAYPLKLLARAPLVLITHGIEVWCPTGNWLRNVLTRKVDGFVAVSNLTKSRFMSWSHVRDSIGWVLPNCFEPGAFAPGPKRMDLLKRYDLEGKTVLMTCGRLVSMDRYKGFDALIEALPDLAKRIPNVAYLIVGDGDNRTRLEQKVQQLGLRDRVVFAGFVSEAEKADHYRLADVYVMPSKGEGFGIVYLEAMACGIPTVGSRVDGSREALRDGLLGILVDPDDRADIERGVLEALARRREVPDGLDYFSFENFRQRVQRLLSDVLGRDHGGNAFRA